jgi:hypothetical protein
MVLGVTMNSSTLEYLQSSVCRLIAEAPADRDAREGTPRLRTWFTQVEMLRIQIETIGRPGAALAEQLRRAMDWEGDGSQFWVGASPSRWDSTPRHVVISRGRIAAVWGVLEGILQSLEHGLLTNLAVRVTSEVYADLLTQAQDQLNMLNLPCAAILMRLSLERNLRLLAAHKGMENAEARALKKGERNASFKDVNIWLWKNGFYPQATSERISSWYTMGSEFAHGGNYENYDKDLVAETIGEVKNFLANYLSRIL